MKALSSLVVVLMALVVSVSGAHAVPLPAWDTVINSPARFKVLSGFSGQAVLDKETGLVWEQSPDTNTRNWASAHAHCQSRTVGATRDGGGRKGWRLPTIQELTSLVDPGNPGGDPDLPPGHPFTNVQPFFAYWSATSEAEDASRALNVLFNNGAVGVVGKANLLFAWCVRSGNSGPEGL